MGTIIALLLGNKFVIMFTAGVVAVVGAWFKGRSGGKKSERDRQNRARQKVNRDIDEIEDEISGRSLDDLRKKLKQWSVK